MDYLVEHFSRMDPTFVQFYTVLVHLIVFIIFFGLSIYLDQDVYGFTDNHTKAQNRDSDDISTSAIKKLGL